MPDTRATTFEKLSPLTPALDCGTMGRSSLAFLRFSGESLPDDIVRLCLKSARRVELLGPGAVLLDLGVCRGDEAPALMRDLLSHLGEHGIAVQAGIGATGILAQLALLTHPTPSRPALRIPLVTPGERPAFLGSVPVRLLSQLYPRGIINPDHMARLDQYGLHTLGQIARLGESTLRRQFGAITGAFLAAIAAGCDPRPFSPALPPLRQGLRLRFVAPASPERLLSALPYLSQSATGLLWKCRLQTGRLHIRLRWVEGETRHARETLRQPTNDKRLLTQALQRMALPLLSNHSARWPNEAEQENQEDGGIAELQLFLEDEITAGSKQQALWPRQTQPAELATKQEHEHKLAILQTLSKTLTRRHGDLRRQQPLLFRSCLRCPDAIFPEERYSREDFAS